VDSREQALREAAAHELAARRNPRKAGEHLLAARLLRERYDVREKPTVSFGRDHDRLNRQRAVRDAENQRTEEFKRR
jgi:hypothetical protein